MIEKLSIDIETYSESDLLKTGVYRYAEDPSFRILLFGYSINDGPVEVVDLASGEKIPGNVLAALEDEKVFKWAFNAAFERVCLSVFLGYPTGTYLDPSSWRCSMIWSAYMGLPLSLKGVGAVLRLDEQKMDEGKDLIRYFCRPCTPTISNGGRTRNLPSDDIDKWTVFKKYNVRDVEVEMAIQKKLQKFPVPDSVWEEWARDQRINDAGVLVDERFVDNALLIDAASKEDIISRMTEITNLENPNSVSQMKSWLHDHGLDTESLGKNDVQELLKTAPDHLKEILTLRLKLAKSSVKKYEAMKNSMCSDGRGRGFFQFYGSRTGRWAGRLVQLQNLPQNKIDNIAMHRDNFRQLDYGTLDLLYDDVPDILSQLIRTAFVAPPGKRFIVSDYSAIEARVIAWLAGEKWRMDFFRKGGDVYCESASKMFGVPVEKHGVNGHLRQKGKIAELACGYGGSVGALKAMGAIKMGLEESELKPLVDNWREANPSIVDFWWAVDDAAKDAIRYRDVRETHGIVFEYRSGYLFITLPSGRKLAYVKPRIESNSFGGESITFEGVGTTKKWERIETYGPKLVENIVQAISRDILAYAMKTLSDKKIVMHVHDELIIEADENTTLDEVTTKMAMIPSWAEGLVLNADGYETPFYMKD